MKARIANGINELSEVKLIGCFDGHYARDTF